MAMFDSLAQQDLPAVGYADPSAPAASSTSQDIYELMQMVKGMSDPDLSAVDRASAEDPSARRRRNIGTLLAGAVGGLITRGQGGSALPGMAAAATGFESGASAEGDAKRAAKLKMVDEANKGKSELMKTGLGKILERRFSSTEKMPPEVQSYLFRAGLLPDKQAEFDAFRLKPAADKLPPGVAEFVSVNGRMPKSVEEYQQFHQKPASAMELFYLNELPPEQKAEYMKQRGKGDGTPAIRYDAKGNRIQ